MLLLSQILIHHKVLALILVICHTSKSVITINILTIQVVIW